LELDCSRYEVEKVAKIACIHDFIMSLPEGYDTLIGNRGIKLSGGEKQRICLARAIIRNAPILILDEPTSALDQLTEKKVIQNIRENINGKTIIIVTHRLHSIIDVDCIYILKDGKIVSKGKHEELMKSNAYYRKMYLADDCQNDHIK
jgi:ABC-type multidrug transport system fused ATPase/permease subunit